MRVTKENERYFMAYGKDHLEGNFIEVWDKQPGAVGEKKIEDARGITVNTLIEIAETYGFDMMDEIKTEEESPDSYDLSGSGCGGGCETCMRKGI